MGGPTCFAQLKSVLIVSNEPNNQERPGLNTVEVTARSTCHSSLSWLVGRLLMEKNSGAHLDEGIIKPLHAPIFGHPPFHMKIVGFVT